MSFVGFSTQEIAVKGKTTNNVIMREGSKALYEVVVYGKQKSDLTGSVSSINKDNLTLGGTVANVGQALQGRASEIQVQQNNFAPGSAPSAIIRGGNSISTSNAPLYVVDGFISS